MQPALKLNARRVEIDVKIENMDSVELLIQRNTAALQLAEYRIRMTDYEFACQHQFLGFMTGD